MRGCFTAPVSAFRGQTVEQILKHQAVLCKAEWWGLRKSLERLWNIRLGSGHWDSSHRINQVSGLSGRLYCLGLFFLLFWNWTKVWKSFEKYREVTTRRFTRPSVTRLACQCDVFWSVNAWTSWLLGKYLHIPRSRAAAAPACVKENYC